MTKGLDAISRSLPAELKTVRKTGVHPPLLIGTANVGDDCVDRTSLPGTAGERSVTTPNGVRLFDDSENLHSFPQHERVQTVSHRTREQVCTACVPDESIGNEAVNGFAIN